MRRITAALVTIVLIVVMPQSALAKSPTTKLTIAGGTLQKTIEVSDAQVLKMSNVWGGQFLDRSKGVWTRPPQTLRRYEVSFYTGKGAKRYVLYYCPDFANGPGYIYLPGTGETWHSLNVSAILRYGRDGRWNYASSSWESLLKPLIARAESMP